MNEVATKQFYFLQHLPPRVYALQIFPQSKTNIAHDASQLPYENRTGVCNSEEAIPPRKVYQLNKL